jgi:tripartite-type tricarboxylate transporter receptor subunit TctC
MLQPRGDTTIGRIFAFLIAGLIVLAPAAGLAQDWPTRPIRVVIPFAAGSVSEAIFRTLSPGIEAKLGQRFVVESKPGADGAIGTGEVVRAAPDGYTLLLGPTAVYAVTPHLFKNLGFDPLAALDPISLLADAPLLAVIGANVPAKSLKELADYVRANPGKFNYGSPGTGSPAHLTGAAFAQETGNSLVYVPYKGTPPMVQALLADDIQIAFPTLTGIVGPMKAGRLKVLAVMARRRMPELPGVPTTVEAGFPQWVGGNWWVLAAPHGTNSRIIERLAAEFGSALANAGVRKRIGELGHVPIGLAAAATAAFLRSESARYKSIVELGGIKAE